MARKTLAVRFPVKQPPVEPVDILLRHQVVSALQQLEATLSDRRPALTDPVVGGEDIGSFQLPQQPKQLAVRQPYTVLRRAPQTAHEPIPSSPGG